MSSQSNGHRRGDPRERELRDADPVTERDPETQRSDVAEETEDQANQPGRLAGTALMLRDIWRLIRGEDQRARKVRWMLGLLRPYRRQVTFMLIALVAATAAGLAPPYLAGRAIDSGINAGDAGALTVIVVVFLASALIYWGATYAQTYLVGWVGQRALQDLRERIYTHLQAMSIGFFTRRKPGVLISRLTNDVQALDTLVTDGIVTLISSTLTLVGVVVILLLLDVPLALVTFLTFPLLAVASVVFRVASAGAYRATREKIANITAYLQETLSGVRVVRSFGQEPRHISRMSELNEENRVANLRTVYLNASYFPAVELLSAVGTAVILLYGGYQVIDGNVEIGVLVAFVGYLNQFFDPIQQISQLYTTYQQGMAALDKIFDLLDTAPDMTDKPDAFDPGEIRGRAADGGRLVLVLGRAAVGAGRHRPRGPRGRDGGAGGRDRRGEVDAGEAGCALLRPAAGQGACGRARPSRPAGEVPAPAARDRAPGELPVLGHGAREHRFRAPRRRRRGRARGGADGRRRRLHRAAAERLRYPGRRARRSALGRAAPARRVRPGASCPAADPDPRRGDLERGRSHRADHRAGAGAAACPAAPRS